jgi:hypothetical protein
MTVATEMNLGNAFAKLQWITGNYTMQQMEDLRGILVEMTSDTDAQAPNVTAFFVEYVTGAIDCLVTARDVAPVAALANGYYTVVLDSDDNYVTLKISDDFRANGTGKVAAFLTGPDNTNDYTGFAFVESDGRVAVWSRFKNGYARQAAALAILAGAETRGEFAMGYALKSGRCARCGRQLTVPASLHAGYGPDCITKL